MVQEDAMLSNYDAKAVAEVLGLVLLRASRPSVVSSVFIEKAVEGGLPRNALRHVAELIAGGDKAKASVLERGIVPKTTLERRENKLSPQESERTERVARLFVHARRALGTEAEAREFMITPHSELDGRNPIEAAKTDLGTRRTEQILNALEYGLAL
jgi:putative toxin-antitoxin system antitoxin component (TIGR02293 family)